MHTEVVSLVICRRNVVAAEGAEECVVAFTVSPLLGSRRISFRLQIAVIRNAAQWGNLIDCPVGVTITWMVGVPTVGQLPNFGFHTEDLQAVPDLSPRRLRGTTGWSPFPLLQGTITPQAGEVAGQQRIEVAGPEPWPGGFAAALPRRAAIPITVMITPQWQACATLVDYAERAEVVVWASDPSAIEAAVLITAGASAYVTDLDDLAEAVRAVSSGEAWFAPVAAAAVCRLEAGGTRRGTHRSLRNLTPGDLARARALGFRVVADLTEARSGLSTV